jgi:uncharacterized cupin superfamily protein
VALTAAVVTAGVLHAGSLAQTHAPSRPNLGPATFDWNDMKAIKTETGNVRSLYQGPTATLDELEMHVTTLNAGIMSLPPHQHSNEELLIIRDGTVETLSNGKWVRLGPGSVIFNASNSLHALRNVGATPASYYVISWRSNKTAATP